MSRYIYLDFEYCKSQEMHPDLVCVSWIRACGLSLARKRYWLYKDDVDRKGGLRHIFLTYREQGYIFVSFAVTAEARCFEALGLNPTLYPWIDLYAEWRMLKNCNDEYNYGTYFVRHMKLTSVPPFMRKEKNKGKNNAPVPYSLAGCIGRLFEKDIDKSHKDKMRDLIISAPEKFTDEEKEQILVYCDSDVEWLEQIRQVVTKEQVRLLKSTPEQVEKWQLKRGAFAAVTARMETRGIPLHMPSIKNLRRNVELAKNTLITDLVENFYPFFQRVRKNKKQLLGEWVDKYDKFAEFIETKLPKNVANAWRKTETGLYKQDDEYLKGFEGIDEIEAYRQVRKQLNQLKWLREPGEGEEDLFDAIGSDGRMRSFFGIYGTQTARNAPKAKRFIFAMSAWLRCLIRPPKDYVIVELDYANQEFAIAAILSNDPVMIDAYNSGDPYLYFAKKAGAVPAEGVRKDYEEIRNLFKALILGLQYGMGIKTLSVHLTSVMGRIVTEREAEKLLNLHKKLFRVYWKWLTKIERRYRLEGFLQLPCGWAILKDNPSSLSIRNFPPQGGGSSVMRESAIKMEKNGIPLISLLHDADYIMVRRDADGLKQTTKAKRLMVEAFNEVFNQTVIEIRVDVNLHPDNEPWISGKGEKYYHLLKTYLGPHETKKEKEAKRLGQLKNTVFKPINQLTKG